MSEQIAIKDIVVPEGRRPLNPVKVEEIASSIKAVGLLSAIGVRRHGDAPAELVWGAHRLAACVSLGMKTITAIAVDGLGWDQGHRETADLDDFVKMTEIAENLHRSDLTTQERNEHLAEWVTLLEKREPNSAARRPSSKKPGPKPSAAIAEVAKTSGLTAKTVKNAIKSTKVAPEVRAAADDANLTSKQRLAISRLPEADQLEAVAKLAAVNIAADRTERTSAAKKTTPKPVPDVMAGDRAKSEVNRGHRATLKQLNTMLQAFSALDRSGNPGLVAEAVKRLDDDVARTRLRLLRVVVFANAVANCIDTSDAADRIITGADNTNKTNGREA